jgi:hypothetical protein
MQVMCYHLFGDFPSPLIIGAMSSTVGIFWAMLLACSWLIWAVILWATAWYLMVKDKPEIIMSDGSISTKKAPKLC